MNKYVKAFFHRGMMFGGFGPIVVGIVYAILEKAVPAFSLSGGQVLIAVCSVYLLAFVQAGVSVFNQIEHWPIAKSLLCHFVLLYAAYVGCYLLNDWIPFKAEIVGIFTAIFVVCYFVIWLTVYLIVKGTEKRLNRNLRRLG